MAVFLYSAIERLEKVEMPKINPNLSLDEDFNYVGDRRKRRLKYHSPKVSEVQILTSLADETGGQEHFDFTYRASRHERQWIVSSLGDFYDQQWLTDVLRLLKGGKEASVYQCTADPAITTGYIAAKVYRPRQFRNLKNDHLYREGRERLDSDGNVIVDGGKHHAMDKRTAYGLELMHTSWIEHEFKTMQILHAAGVDVPVPYASGNNAILMQYIGADEMPAPTLNTLELPLPEARLLLDRVLFNIDRMLTHHRIHGDLSAFNILYWEGNITLIDFPQAIDPRQNRNAYQIFERDVVRIGDYFSRQGVTVNSRQIARQIWKTHHYKIKPEVHPSLLDDQDDDDVAYWRALSDE